MVFHTDNIAVLLAAYNGERYIAQQLDSVIAQSCSGWELFIHDDGSNDNTCAIIKKYADKYPDKIHILEAPPCGGAKDNFFYLMGQVDAPYILDENSVPAVYVRAAELGKVQIVKFYFRNRIRKSGLIRNIGFYLFG